MAEISLKEYFDKLNILLSANAADEVIHHSRHVLQFFPKNVTAYRFLGQGLVLNGRWEEGRETLRRVLSVIPDDFAAHLGLSEANERMERPDEAIWHLERALEQSPNDSSLIDGLRGLYRRHRHVDNLKVQLTSAAVARQYLRSSAYTQAIEALRGALARMNDRLDLKLLLAQVLWQNGAQEEAAELALEVLKVLPDCLEANRIMAQLWLSVNRPSDAQRYVNHLEAVDPYLAVELVQGYPAEDDVFRLEELDYARSSQSEMAQARPAWLQEISATPAPTVEAAKETPSEDWSNWASALLSGQTSGDVQKPPTAPAPSERYKVTTPKDEPGFTELFGKPDEAEAEQMSALFENEPVHADDPMAWMHEAGVEMVNKGEEQPAFEDLFAEQDDGALPALEEDPMAWLQDDDENVSVDADEMAAQDEDSFAWMQNNVSAPGAEPTLADSGDARTWLQGDHLLDEALGAETLKDQPPRAGRAPQTERKKAEADESQTPPAVPIEPGVPGPRRGLTAILEEANFDWINKQDEEKSVGDAEMDDWLNQFGTSEPRASVTDTPDWLTDLGESKADDREDDEWFKPDEPAAEFPVAAGAELVRMAADDDDEEDSDWLAEFKPEPGAATDLTGTKGAAPAEPEPADVPDWLAELEPAQTVGEAAEDQAAWTIDESLVNEEAGSQAVSGDMLNWLADITPAQAASTPEPAAQEPAASDNDFAWLTDESLLKAGAEETLVTGMKLPWMKRPVEAKPEPEAVSEEAPDWLSDLEPEQVEPEPQVEPANDETALDAEFPWLTSQPSSELDAEPVAALTEETLVDAQPIANDGEFTWMTDEELADPEPTASDAEFTWMADDALAASEPLINDAEFSWMADEVQPEADAAVFGMPAEAEPETVAGDVPDWLAELQPQQPSNEPEAALTPMADEAQPEAEAVLGVPAEAEPEAVAGDVPDWLAELQPEQLAHEPEAVAGDAEFSWMTEESLAKAESVAGDAEFTWMPEQTPAEAEPEAVAGDIPDWLSDLQPAKEPVLDAEADFAGMTADSQPEAEPEAESAAADFDWTTVEPQPEAEPEVEPLAADADFAWLDEPTIPEDEETPGQRPEPVTAEDWQDASEEMAFDEENGWLLDSAFDDGEALGENDEEFASAAEDGDEALEPSPAQNAPDWLNAMVPGLDVDYEAADGESEDIDELVANVTKRDYAWVVELVEQETAADRPRFVFSRPPIWLEPVNPMPQNGDEDDDLPDWPSDDADVDVPEWLR